MVEGRQTCTKLQRVSTFPQSQVCVWGAAIFISSLVRGHGIQGRLIMFQGQSLNLSDIPQ